MKGVFITGTDTGCGKTRVSCALLAAAREAGIAAVGMKPVATGAEHVDGRLVNEDVAALTVASGVTAPAELINPYLFEPPCSPHLAAAAAGVRIEPGPIAAACAALGQRAEFVVVEGVGGWRVPLGPHLELADLAVQLRLPVLLVVGVRLGCINHALLSAQAIAASGVTLAGWIANRLEGDLFDAAGVFETLEAAIPAPRLATLEWNGGLPAAVAAGLCERLPEGGPFPE